MRFVVGFSCTDMLSLRRQPFHCWSPPIWQIRWKSENHQSHFPCCMPFSRRHSIQFTRAHPLIWSISMFSDKCDRKSLVWKKQLWICINDRISNAVPHTRGYTVWTSPLGSHLKRIALVFVSIETNQSKLYWTHTPTNPLMCHSPMWLFFTWLGAIPSGYGDCHWVQATANQLQRVS